MPNRITRAALLLASCSVMLAPHLYAQEKAAPRLLTRTTSSEAATAALASALEEATNFGGARRADAKLKAIVDADPNFALGRAVYGAFTNTLTAADRTRELETALGSAGKASAEEVLFILALREWRGGRTAAARVLTDLAIETAPDDPTLMWFRMLVAANNDEALRVGADALKRFPDHPGIHNFMAYRLNTAGRKDEAIATVQKYAQLAPNHPNSHDSYAEILALQGRYDEAAQHYQKAIELDGGWEVGHEGLAEVAAARGRYAEARTHLQHALAIAPAPARKVALQREIAATHLMEGKVKEARAVMTQVIADAEANSINTLPDKRVVGWLLVFEGRGAEAAKQYAAGQPTNPGPTFPLSDAIFNAITKQQAGVAKALAAMETNAARAPDVQDTQEALRTTRVVAAASRGDLDEAVQVLKQINTPVYRALAASFVAQNARKAKQTAVAAEALADVDAYKAINLNAAFARYNANRK